VTSTERWLTRVTCRSTAALEGHQEVYLGYSLPLIKTELFGTVPFSCSMSELRVSYALRVPFTDLQYAVRTKHLFTGSAKKKFHLAHVCLANIYLSKKNMHNDYASVEDINGSNLQVGGDSGDEGQYAGNQASERFATVFRY
jgi:hypothetical protein